MKGRSVGGLLEAVRNGAGRSKFKSTHTDSTDSCCRQSRSGTTASSRYLTQPHLRTLSSHNVGRIMAFKGLFAVQWRDARSMPLREERWRDGEVFIRVSLKANERMGLFYA